MKPRYNIHWTESGEYFAGYANELDVWVEFPNDRNDFSIPIVLVAAPEHLVIGTIGYDALKLKTGGWLFETAMTSTLPPTTWH
jgi:hypothetical protein